MPKLGYKQTEKHKKAISCAMKGIKFPNRKKPKEQLYHNKGWLYQKYIVEKLSMVGIGKLCGCMNNSGQIYFYLKQYRIKTRTISQANIGKKRSKKFKKQMSEIKKGCASWNKGLTAKSDERIVKQAGRNHYNWQGGISNLPYAFEFNEQLKDFVRQRDDFTCQFCGISENSKTHDVHHIDYDKKNSCEINLILLCKSCNARANHNRKGWQFLFETLQEIRL